MKRILLMSLVLVAFFMAGCSSPAIEDSVAPTISSVSPADAAVDVSISGNIAATFDEEMDSATITNTSFTLKQGSTDVPGEVSYASNVATYNPTNDLALGTVYTATITVSAADMAGNAMEAAKVWTFTTAAAPPAGPAKVVLGTAGNYVILAETGITTTGVTAITGDIAVSPITAAAMTGFGLIMDSTNTFSTSSLVTGKVYAANYTEPTPTTLTAAIAAKLAAYNDAAGRTSPDESELGTGEIGGMTLVPGLYNWTTGVSITTNVTLDGAANDVWIFQIGGGMTQAATAQVLMTGGASPENVFWQVSGAVALAATAHMEGTVLSAGAISLAAGTTVNGRLLSQTAVTLDANTIVDPSL